jgi:hypothetical protein
VNPSVSATLFDARRSNILSVETLLSLPLGDYDSARAAIAKHASKQAARHNKVTSASTIATETDEEDEETAEDDDDDGGTDGGESTDVDADARPAMLNPQATIRLSPKRPFWQKPFAPRSAAKAPPVLGTSTAIDASLPASTALDSSEPLPPTAGTSGLPLPDLVALAAVPSPVDQDQEVTRSQTELDSKVLVECLRTMKVIWSRGACRCLKRNAKADYNFSRDEGAILLVRD